MKIRNQLRLVMAVTLVSLLAVMALSGHTLLNLRQDYQHFQALESVEKAILQIEAQGLATSRDDPILVDETRPHFEKTDAVVGPLFKTLDDSLQTDDARQSLANIKAHWDSYYDGWMTALDIAQDSPADALSIPDVLYNQHLKPAVDGLNALAVDVRSEANAASARIEQAMERIVWIVITPLVGAVILIALFQGWVGRRLRRNIDHVSAAVDRLQQGDLSQRLPHQNDEIGEICQRINTFVDQVERLVEAIGMAVTETRTSVHDLVDRSDSVNANAQAQEDRLNRIGSAMGDMDDKGHNMAAFAQQAMAQVEETRNLVEQGNRAGEDTVQVLQRVSERVETAASRLDALDGELRQIDQVLDVIGAITEQTNLLALNASIEAARAGEHGRGFAVVADEVRQLSRKTASSTSNIHNLIRTIGSHTEEVLAAMGDARDASRQGLASGDEMDRILGNIDAAIRETSGMVERMVATTEDQAGASADVVQSMHAMDDLRRATGEEIQATGTAIGRLGDVADQLVVAMGVYGRVQ
ncbi:methyl-accepting chemotaxis protein [Marinobacter halodurans]|uniref:Methyl-accepting chemotaxis protein n=1 Tax=Marinobacter halodurans TaxID=2528979 RepID=A0ABY1ZS02_9GAMM|nr:methyl-accepting chemotaxis protein [Marinobacter halodurans]TBW57693.1 methyl-accepting chemotaxis protein [Marinobacter halodurans]